jgi:hypothetical protein
MDEMELVGATHHFLNLAKMVARRVPNALAVDFKLDTVIPVKHFAVWDQSTCPT